MASPLDLLLIGPRLGLQLVGDITRIADAVANTGEAAVRLGDLAERVADDIGGIRREMKYTAQLPQGFKLGVNINPIDTVLKGMPVWSITKKNTRRCRSS